MFARCGGDDFSTEYDGSGPVDLGRFITATVVVTGFALPLVLAHSEVITKGACAMSIAGGGCVHDPSRSHLFLTPSTVLYMVPSWRTAKHSRKGTRTTINGICIPLEDDWTTIVLLLPQPLYTIVLLFVHRDIKS